jgi:hypothetical protein
MFTKKCIGQHVRGRQVVSLATGRRHLFRDVTFEQCEFDSVLIGKPDTDIWRRRHEFHNVRALECRFRNCLLKHALLEHVTFERCSAPDGGLVLWKCVLHEVVFDGVYESLRVIPPDGYHYAEDPDVGPSFAIDVRTTRCGEVELLGIPPSLVRYDSAIGGVVSRGALAADGWPAGEVSEYFGGIMVKFKAYGGNSSVYIVPTEAPEGPELLKELAALRSRGWVQ